MNVNDGSNDNNIMQISDDLIQRLEQLEEQIENDGDSSTEGIKEMFIDVFKQELAKDTVKTTIIKSVEGLIDKCLTGKFLEKFGSDKKVIGVQNIVNIVGQLMK